MLKTHAFFDTATNTISYLVWQDPLGDAMLIDPVLDYEPKAASLTTESADKILSFIAANKLTLKWVLDTHPHADHLSASDYIRRKTGAKLGIGAGITKVQSTFSPLFLADDVTADGAQFDVLFKDEDSFSLGDDIVRVLHTPGHTTACVTYVVGDMAFVGDTLFMPDYGTARADFPGGDAKTLYRSIQRILKLPEATRIFVGHDYLPKGRTDYHWETTVAEQRANNIHIHEDISEEDYVAMRNARDKTLNAPRLILPSLQVNIRAGALPPPAKDGNHYLTIPVNRFA